MFSKIGNDLAKIGDRRIEIIKQIAEKYDKMDDKTAEKLLELTQGTIGDKLRLDTRCDCVAVEQLRFGTWLDQLPGARRSRFTPNWARPAASPSRFRTRATHGAS